MTPRRTARHTLSVLSVLSAVSTLSGACSPERLRPGPPSIQLEFPDGTDVTSPDTISIRVEARDPNGLDSVTIALDTVSVTINAFAQIELIDAVFFLIPDGLAAGTQLTALGVAADLTGQMTRETVTLRVVGGAGSP